MDNRKVGIWDNIIQNNLLLENWNCKMGKFFMYISHWFWTWISFYGFLGITVERNHDFLPPDLYVHICVYIRVVSHFISPIQCNEHAITLNLYHFLAAKRWRIKQIPTLFFALYNFGNFTKFSSFFHLFSQAKPFKMIERLDDAATLQDFVSRPEKKKSHLNGHTSIMFLNKNNGSILHLKGHSNFIPFAHLFLLISIFYFALCFTSHW